MKVLLVIMILESVSCKDSGSQQAAEATPTTTTSTEVANQVTPVATPAPVITVANPSITEEFMNLINDHRISIGLHPLVNDPEMVKIAQTQSDEMATGAVAFGHTGFSGRCSAARSALGGGNMCGENVAEGQKSAQAVYTAWMNSPGHRANIEQSRYSHGGFGFQKNSSGVYYWTHLFLER